METDWGLVAVLWPLVAVALVASWAWYRDRARQQAARDAWVQEALRRERERRGEAQPLGWQREGRR